MLEGWDFQPLSNLASFVSGGTPNKSTPHYWGGDIPWVTVSDMKSLRLKGVAYKLTQSGASQVRTVGDGTILILVRGMGLFKDLPITLIEQPVCFNQDIKGLIPKDSINGEFLAYALIARKPDILKHIESAGHGTGRLDTDLLKSTLIPLPPLPEQLRIAEILRTWDMAIEKLEALRAAKERRFLALRENLIRRDAAKAKPTSIGNVLTESRMPGSDGAKAKKITVKLYGLGAVPKESERGGGSVNTKYYTRSAGQLVYSKLDFLNGAFAIIPPSLNGFETTLDLPAFDIDDDVNAEWLLQYLIRPEYYSNQSEMARGQRKARRISPTEFLASEIRLPKRTEQDKAAAIFLTAKQDADVTSRQIIALQRQQRGLMQKLLTGEWRVKLDAVAETAK